MIPNKASLASFRILPPKVSLRKVCHRATALCLLFAGLGLPSEAAAILSPAFAEESAPHPPTTGSEQWMVGVYQDGKRQFELGDYDGAEREWSKLSGSYDKNPSLKVIVDFMRKRIKEDPDTIKRGRKYQEEKNQISTKQVAAETKARTKAEKNQRSEKYSSGEEKNQDKGVKAFLDKARADVTKQVRSTHPNAMSLDARRRQQQMLALFAKGKQAYLQGDLEGAVGAWGQAVDYLPAKSQARAELEKLKMNAQRLAEERNIPAPESPDKPVEPPADMKDFLELVNARFRSEAQEGRARTSQRETSTSDRQSALDRSFQKTKLLYFQGQYEQAIDELNALAKYFPSQSEEARLISGLRENYLAALEAQSAAKTAPVPSAKLQSPAELRSFVEQAKHKFDTMLDEAQAERSVSERTAVQREEFVRSAFERARSYFESGRTDDALSELERVAPYVENETEIRGLIENVRAKQTRAEKVKESIESSGLSDSKIDRAATKGITDFLQDAGRRLDDQSKKISGQKKEVDTAVRDRSRRLIDLFQNARTRYDAGDLEGALTLLSQMTPDVENGKELERAIGELRADMNETRRADKELQTLKAEGEKWPVPADLSSLLNETRDNIRTHADDMRQTRDSAKRSSDERKRGFDAAYSEGRSAYNAGDLKTALREWEKLIPLVENGEEFERYLGEVRRDYEAAVEAENSSKQFEGEGPIRLPEDFYQLLNQTASQARARAQKAVIDRQAAETGFAKNRDAVTRAYEVGRAAYNAGDLPKAVAEWRTLVPLVEDGAALGAALDGLDREYQAANSAIENAEKASQRPGEHFRAPAELDKLLVEAQKQIVTRGRDAKAQVQTLENSAAERRAAFDRALVAGRSAYESGDLNKAITAWKALVPMVDDGSELERQLNELLGRYQTAQKDIEAVRIAQKQTLMRVPVDIVQSLTTAGKDLESRTRLAAADRAALEKVAGEKRAVYDRAIAEGAQAHNAGDLEKAIAAWQKLVPVVEEGAALEKQLTTAREKFLQARQVLEAAEKAQKRASFTVPSDIGSLLSKAQTQLEARAAEAMVRQEELEKSSAQKRIVYEQAIANGKAAHKAGDLEKALAAWGTLVPVVDNGATLQKQLTATHEKILEQRQALEAVDDAQKHAFFTAPSDISQLLSEAQTQLKAQAAEATTLRETLEKSAAQKRAIYDQAIATGKAAQKTGDLEKAFTAWEALVPIVENGPALSKQIASAREQFRAAQTAGAAFREISSQKTLLFALPVEVGAALSDISTKLQADLAQSRELIVAAENKAAERRNRVHTVIAEGMGLYKNGLTAEAVARWESILSDLEDADRLQKTLFDLQRVNRDLEAVQKTALQSEIEAKRTLPPPADLTKALSLAFTSANSKLEEAKNRQTGANDESVRRQTIVTESVQNGKLALARGEVDAAIAEWTKAAPYLESGQTLLSQLQDLKILHVKLVDAQKVASAAEERNFGKVKALPELDAFITESSLKYKNDADAANVRKEQAEAAFAQKRALVEYTVNKAREIFERGDIPGASLEALKLQVYVEDPLALQAEVGKIQAEYEQSLKAQTEASAAVKHASEALFKAPPDLQILLKDADVKVKELTQLAMNQKLEADQSLKEKEAFVQGAFERGKKLYWEGKIDEALVEWDSLAPLLENGGKVKEVSGRYAETLHLQRQAREMNARKNEKFKTPEELQRLLNDAEKILSSQSNFATVQQRTAQDELSGRQEFLNKTFQKGKALYEQGMITDAIEEWEKLAPVLENGSKVKEFIDGVKANFKGALAAKQGAEEAQARTLVQPQAPADLTRLLNEANIGLQAETRRSQEERQKAEEALREKQKMIDGIFQKGKMLYQAGRLEEAVDTWKTLFPFVDDNTTLRQLIQQAEDSRRQLLAERFETQNNVASAAAPGAMQFALEETNAALKDQISQRHAARLEADLKELVQSPADKKASKALPLEPVPFKLDEIEEMMLEYKVVTPEELQKRRDELKTKAPAEA